MTYLLDVNALIALGITIHEFHQRVDAWIATLDSPTDRLATCAVTELAFVRIVPQLPGLGASIAQAKELLRRAVGADHLPAWVKTARQTTDGHLLELAKRHSTTLATLNDKIPGAFLVPEQERSHRTSRHPRSSRRNRPMRSGEPFNR